jgi:hypothetical protein
MVGTRRFPTLLSLGAWPIATRYSAESWEIHADAIESVLYRFDGVS